MKKNESENLNSDYTCKDISVFKIYLQSFFHKSTRKSMLRYLGTVLKDFFLLQFSVKLGFKKIPVVNVDHPLDETVPFTPERVSVYLDFICFWIRPLVYIGRRFGKEAQYKYTEQFLDLVNTCYLRAAEIYRFRMSTTRRPKYLKGQFFTIHALDPHFLCVPSLHVIIVVLAYTFYRKAFAELNMLKDEMDTLSRELFAGAIEITETVLYIKQHSVNCIPAALYTIGNVTPDEVSPVEAAVFIESLFAGAEDIHQENVANIRRHIFEIYERLLLEGCHESDWSIPLKRWLDDAYPLEETAPEDIAISIQEEETAFAAVAES
ncbi:hypothetical protein K7I13_04385 [Brucepastera parasyntrophica]|uniref:hypothetical protein n=1 Tax=Brucepastera parasyntrophica TaxID=2880008 RepID=UPI00210C8FA5|nr:hypothetical protein [Brucepastera parasyntrophica]ULQ60537.1 hypothetical protein K7I13_04385 [Brucepastera parasyntrophica]